MSAAMPASGTSTTCRASNNATSTAFVASHGVVVVKTPCLQSLSNALTKNELTVVAHTVARLGGGDPSAASGHSSVAITDTGDGAVGSVLCGRGGKGGADGPRSMTKNRDPTDITGVLLVMRSEQKLFKSCMMVDVQSSMSNCMPGPLSAVLGTQNPWLEIVSVVARARGSLTAWTGITMRLHSV